MIEMNIIANQSIEEDIIEVLEARGFRDSFSLFSPLFGRGRHGRREASAIWPEKNVMFYIVMEDDQIDVLVADLKMLKEKFEQEGIRCYVKRDVNRLL